MKEVDLANLAAVPYEEFREKFPGMCVNLTVTPEAIDKTAREIYRALGKLPLTVQESHAFMSMIQRELGNFYLGKHAGRDCT